MIDGAYVYGSNTNSFSGYRTQFGEIESYWGRYPKYRGYVVHPQININGGDRELLSSLNAGYRTTNKLWKKLPAEPNDRK